MMMGMFNIISK